MSARMLACLVAVATLVLAGSVPTRAAETPTEGAATAAPPPAEPRADNVVVDYVRPKDPKLVPIWERAKESRMLELMRLVFAPLRLPRPLTLRTTDCDGEVNAFYENDVVSVCYEYLAYIDRLADRRSRPRSISRRDAFLGTVLEVFLHEGAHAIFDMLRIPVLGREEDAADHLAALGLLSFEPELSRSLVAGTVHMHLADGGFRSPRQLGRRHIAIVDPRKDADEHSRPLQRMYSVTCLALGSGKPGFAEFATRVGLPADRAEQCADEYRQIVHAFRVLILPHVDPRWLADLGRLDWYRPPAP